MRVEVRSTGLREMRHKRGLTQRQLARDLGISQNYIPAIEANARQAETPAKFNAAEEERLRQLHAEGLISERDYQRAHHPRPDPAG